VTGQSADIGVTKAVDNATPNLGTNVTFTITATNHGPSDATGVQVADLLPAGLTFVSASSGSYTSGTGIWMIGALANGASATLSIVATATRTTAVINIATVVADQPDSNSANNSDSATVTGQSADIAITKTVSNASPNLGTNVTFTITATNNGPGNAAGVQVTDRLAAGLTVVLATPSAGSYDPVTGIWIVGALANTASATLSIVATVTSTARLTNTATKTAEDQFDAVSGNNAASATVTALGADIGITKTVDNPTPNLGGNVTFTITVTNNGPGNATGVHVTDLLPTGLTLVLATPSAGSYDPITGIWIVGALANTASATLSIIATVTGTTVTNTATKTAEDQLDSNPANDSASATVTDAPALPGLPNTSGPDTSTAWAIPDAPPTIPALPLAVLAVITGLAVIVLAGNRARLGRRGSRSSRHGARLAVGLFAIVVSLTPSTLSVGEVSQPAVALAPGSQLIGGKVVSVIPPAGPTAEIFHRVTGPIIPSRLRIPSIGVDAAVGAVGLRADGSMDVPDNLWTSSWWAGGPQPGQVGNAVIAGHRGVGSPALFSHLENVQPGDWIYVSDGAGSELIYVVTRVASLDLSNSTRVAVFGNGPTSQLVLITCFGDYIASARTYDRRLVVFSRPLLPIT
jgi:LPXTG-site transpeptidase (sortase) family protein